MIEAINAERAALISASAAPADPGYALCTATLESIAYACMDAISLVRQLQDDEDGALSRLLEVRLQMMGMEVSRVLKALPGHEVPCEVDAWLLSPRELELVRTLERR